MESVSTALTPKETATLLGAALAAIRAEVMALSDPVRRFHPAPGEWCVKEVLGHLIETERRGFAGRIRIILDGDEPALQAWDQEAVARERRDCERDANALLAEFTTMRTDSVTLAAGLAATDLKRGGQHPTVGHLTVADLLHEWVHHDRNHIRQMLANVQSFAWPHMGNARRFSPD